MDSSVYPKHNNSSEKMYFEILLKKFFNISLIQARHEFGSNVNVSHKVSEQGWIHISAEPFKQNSVIAQEEEVVSSTLTLVSSHASPLASTLSPSLPMVK